MEDHVSASTGRNSRSVTSDVTHTENGYTDADSCLDQLMYDVMISQSAPARSYANGLKSVKSARSTSASSSNTKCDHTKSATTKSATTKSATTKSAAKTKSTNIKSANNMYAKTSSKKNHRQNSGLNGLKKMAATTSGQNQSMQYKNHAHMSMQKERIALDRDSTDRFPSSTGCNSDGQYSAKSSTHDICVKQINLYEYEKAKPIRLSKDRYSDYYGYHRDLHLYEKKSSRGSLDEEEDDQFNVFICLLCCIMGLGVIIGLVILLCQYVEQKEMEQEKGDLGPGDENFLQLLNNVYSQRIAQLIQRVDNSSMEDKSSQFKEKLKLCPLDSPYLVGNSTDVNLNISVNIDVINQEHNDVQMGGEWRPASCISRHRVAIIIPYRDRWNHLKVLLHYLIPTLKRQQIHFRIFVVEQFGNETFNKGRIMNAAFREALPLFDFQCVTFHDVDLVPEDDRNMYSCTEQPKHMSISIDKFQYTLPYQGLVGGVLMFRTDHFQLVNGYSNMYWGWGAEDDDMTTRILHRGLRIYRPPSNIARYKMVKHEGRKGSEVAVRMKLLRSAARRSKLEGLNNVQYKLVSTQIRELFTHFIVDIGTP